MKRFVFVSAIALFALLQAGCGRHNQRVECQRGAAHARPTQPVRQGAERQPHHERSGRVAGEQGTDVGITERQLQWLLERGRWHAVRPGVYAVGGVPVTKHMTLLAACLAAGSDAVASHRAAAWTWGYDPFDSCPLEVGLHCSSHRRAGSPSPCNCRY